MVWLGEISSFSYLTVLPGGHTDSLAGRATIWMRRDIRECRFSYSDHVPPLHWPDGRFDVPRGEIAAETQVVTLHALKLPQRSYSLCVEAAPISLSCIKLQTYLFIVISNKVTQ